MILLPTGRYAHQRSLVSEACTAAGFTHVEVEDTVLRMENGAPVNGFVVWATKGAVKSVKTSRAPKAPKAVKANA